MSASSPVLASVGLGHVLADVAVHRGPDGTLFEATGHAAAGLSPEALRALRHVLERERPGSSRHVLHACGHAAGRACALRLDTYLAANGKPALAGLPLEAALALLTRNFAAEGWGLLTLDLALAADHGLVLAALEHSAFAEAQPGTNDFVDAVPAGFIKAFFEHLTGQALSCEEIACRSRGAPYCRFVITAAARLAPVLPFIGREPADTIIARLRN
jgi:predicted hydrocarbon binding protein